MLFCSLHPALRVIGDGCDWQGCFWVGTGAVDMFTTTNNVAYGKKAQHEYQKRNPNFDGKVRIEHGIF